MPAHGYGSESETEFVCLGIGAQFFLFDYGEYSSVGRALARVRVPLPSHGRFKRNIRLANE